MRAHVELVHVAGWWQCERRPVSRLQLVASEQVHRDVAHLRALLALSLSTFLHRVPSCRVQFAGTR